jgi:hypothetical protein
MRANPDVALRPGSTQSANFFIHTTLEDWPWHDGALAFHLARLWSVLLSTATVAAVYLLARSALPERPGVALLATGVAATLPEFVFIGTAVNNDNAAALFATLSLWGGFAIYQARGDWRAGWWTCLALGFGLLSKVSTLAIWPIVALAILLGTARSPTDESTTWRQGLPRMLRQWRRWLAGGIITFLPAILIASPWLWRNWRLYGDPSGMAHVRATIDLRTTPWTWNDSQWLLKGLFLSFWGKFGAAGHIPYPPWVYWFLAAITLAGALGALAVWLRAPRARVAILLLGLAAFAVVAGIWQYSLIALGTDQGRLLFPAIGPICILLALGLASWPVVKARHWLAGGMVAALAILSIYALTGIIRPRLAPQAPPYSTRTVQATSNTNSIDFDELTLNGWTLEGNPILYWQAARTPTQDWRVALRVTAEDGALVWEWRRSPGYGRLSSDHWTAQTVVQDEYRIMWPQRAGAGRYRVEATLYPFGGKPGEEQPYRMLGWLEKSN